VILVIAVVSSTVVIGSMVGSGAVGAAVGVDDV